MMGACQGVAPLSQGGMTCIDRVSSPRCRSDLLDISHWWFAAVSLGGFQKLNDL